MQKYDFFAHVRFDGEEKAQGCLPLPPPPGMYLGSLALDSPVRLR